MRLGAAGRGSGLRPAAVVVAATLLVTGCEFLPDWVGSAEQPPLPGERVSILSLERSLEPDPGIADLEVRLPKPYANKNWPQPGGVASHAMHHLKAGASLRQVWKVSAGAGAGDNGRITATPVVADGRIFVLDTRTRLAAFDAGSGRELWRVDLTPKDEDEGGFGGGITYARGRVYAATGFGDVVAVDARTGDEQWRRRIGIPMRAGPTVAGERLFVISYDNQLHALSVATGEVLWTHVGISENAGLLGAASPAVEGGIVVAAYSSGEIYALRADNGRIAWSDSLTRVRRVTALSVLSDIVGQPVIDRGQVIAISHSGTMAAIDMRTGTRIWDQDIGGLQTPWVAGNFIFVVTTDAEVVALSRRDGRIRWVRALERFKNPDERKEPINWSGPVLAGDRLVLVSSNGKAVAVSPYTGDVLGSMKLPGGVSVPPIVADGTVYLLTDAGKLLALR